MHRQLEPFERRTEPFDSIGEGDWRGGIGQQGGACDQADDPYAHYDRGCDPLHSDPQNPPLEDHIPFDEEHVQNRGEQDNWDHRTQAFQDHNRRDFGKPVGEHQKQDAHRKPDRVGRGKQDNDVTEGQQDFYPRIELVDRGTAWKILSDSDIFKHRFFPPSRAAKAAPALRSPWCRRSRSPGTPARGACRKSG